MSAEISPATTALDPAPAAHAGRVVAIDALRGFDMFWIIGGKPLALALGAAFIHEKTAPEWLRTQLNHTHWVGFTSYDLIMPLFLFIVGAAMPFSFARHLASGASHRVMHWRLASRFVLLWVLGMMVQGNLLKLDWAIFRPATNVLQAIAFGYTATGLILLHVPRRWQGWFPVGLLMGYWLIMVLVPVPGLGAGVLEEDRNLATWIDLQVLGSHAYRHAVNGGFTTHYAYLLTMLPFSATVMIGMHAGRWLGAAHTARRKLSGLVIAGVGALVLGGLWSLWFPIIKPIFTSSMVLWACGWSLLLLALFYALIDVLGSRRWAFPFVVIGANALFAYVVSHIFGAQVSGVSSTLFTGLIGHLQPFIPGPVVRACGTVLVLWLVLWFLYRNKLFWRV